MTRTVQLHAGADDSVIRSVWYGQRSLGETWWMWNVLIGNILLGSVGGLVSGGLVSATGSGFPMFLHLALMIPYGVWVMVGAWRSATNHPGFWAGVVKFLVILAIPINLFLWAGILSQGLDPMLM